MTRAGPAPAIRTCWCGAWYGNDPDGHASHQRVHRHRPAEPAADPPPEQQQPPQEEEG